MTLRFPSGEFDALDEKRFRLKTSFQAIGRQLFTSWLRLDGEMSGIQQKPAQDSHSNSEPQVESTGTDATAPWHTLLDLILKRGSPGMQNAIQSNLETFAEAALVIHYGDHKDIPEETTKLISAAHREIDQRSRGIVQTIRGTVSRARASVDKSRRVSDDSGTTLAGDRERRRDSA